MLRLSHPEWPLHPIPCPPVCFPGVSFHFPRGALGFLRAQSEGRYLLLKLMRYQLLPCGSESLLGSKGGVGIPAEGQPGPSGSISP